MFYDLHEKYDIVVYIGRGGEGATTANLLQVAFVKVTQDGTIKRNTKEVEKRKEEKGQERRRKANSKSNEKQLPISKIKWATHTHSGAQQ